MATSSPTQRALWHLRDDGWTAQVVERWNQYAKVRQDLFGVIDIVAMREGTGILGVQATSGSNHSTRVKKIIASTEAHVWVKSGAELWVMSFEKKKGRYITRIEEIDSSYFAR